MTTDESWECVDCIVMGCSQYGEIVALYEKKLAIAVEALESIEQQRDGFGCVRVAWEALRKIGEVK
jgi:hypothetical protein